MNRCAPRATRCGGSVAWLGLLILGSFCGSLCVAPVADAASKPAASTARSRAKKQGVESRVPANRNTAAKATKPKRRALAAPAALVAEPRDYWREARDLADRGQPDSALALLRPVLAGDSGSFDLRWLQAGITGDAGRAAEAVTLYERLSAAFPERAGELLGDLGKERLRSDDPRGAARDLRGWLAGHSDDAEAKRRLALALARSDSLEAALATYDELLAAEPGDTELALDRARVLSWMGRHGQAIAGYRAVLQREPESASAELGLAKNENWLGHHRSATRRLETLVGRSDADAETWKALAFARYWDDDPDGALRALEAHRHREPEDREARELMAQIRRDNAPQVEIGNGQSHDSDDLTVTSPTVEVSWPLAMHAAASAGWRRDLADDGGGSSDITQFWGGARYRFMPAVSAYARGTSYTWKRGPGVTRGGEAGVTLRPMDLLRFEVVTNREPVVTRASLDLGISLLTWAAVVEWNPRSRVTLHLEGRAGSFSDGNRSERTGATARWQVLDGRRWDVTGRLDVEQFSVHQDLDNGYYDPDFTREWGPGIEIEWRPESRWSLRGTAKTGWQRDKGDSDAVVDAFYGLGARARWRPTEEWNVSLEGGGGDSNLQSAAGYRRSWVRFSLAKGF